MVAYLWFQNSKGEKGHPEANWKAILALGLCPGCNWDTFLPIVRWRAVEMHEAPHPHVCTLSCTCSTIHICSQPTYKWTHTLPSTHTHKWLPFVLFLVLSVSVIKVTNLDGSQKSICRWLCLNSYHPWCYLNISVEFLKYCSYRWHLNNSH